jgi:hypothetical protein
MPKQYSDKPFPGLTLIENTFGFLSAGIESVLLGASHMDIVVLARESRNPACERSRSVRCIPNCDVFQSCGINRQVERKVNVKAAHVDCSSKAFPHTWAFDFLSSIVGRSLDVGVVTRRNRLRSKASMSLDSFF